MSLFWEQINIFWCNFHTLFLTHSAISSANLSISTLLLQKCHIFKHKVIFYTVNKHQITSKPVYTQIFSYDMFEMQKNRQP